MHQLKHEAYTFSSLKSLFFFQLANCFMVIVVFWLTGYVFNLKLLCNLKRSICASTLTSDLIPLPDKLLNLYNIENERTWNNGI